MRETALEKCAEKVSKKPAGKKKAALYDGKCRGEACNPLSGSGLEADGGAQRHGEAVGRQGQAEQKGFDDCFEVLHCGRKFTEKFVYFGVLWIILLHLKYFPS